jgi:hypothetical protein
VQVRLMAACLAVAGFFQAPLVAGQKQPWTSEVIQTPLSIFH